jgi:tripeptidyl-peptidase-1
MEGKLLHLMRHLVHDFLYGLIEFPLNVYIMLVLQGNSSWSGKGYFPSFPATCPYVTAVGATMGPELKQTEIACQSQLGGIITTGGGFSTYYSTPSYQQSIVDYYFDNLKSKPRSGYNSEGRGYPDIAFIGVNYQVYIQGSIYSLYGTSASAPVLAAMVSLINAERLKNNQSSVGFLNPTLYAYGYGGSYYGSSSNSFEGKYPFNDITSGVNNCTATTDSGTAYRCSTTD